MHLMKTAFQTIAIIGKYNTPDMRDYILAMAAFLADRQVSVFIEKDTALHCNITGYQALNIDAIGARVELAIVLGGDGTMLWVARALMDDRIPLIGINRGRFGFLTDLTADSMLEGMGKILAGAFNVEQRMLLSASILHNGKTVGQGIAMNDVVISKGSIARLIELEVNIDGQFVYKQRSDGLILSTPTGTTAYSLSAGGPVLHPTLDAIALVPICPHTLSNRPIAINSASKVEVTLIQAEDACIHFDGQQQSSFQQGDKVLVQRADKTVSLLHPLGHSHYDMLREKLNWG
jgi:NAD+ kinase